MAGRTKPSRRPRKPALVNPLAHLTVIKGMRSMSLDEVIHRAGGLQSAVERTGTCTATQADWRLIFDCVNLMEQLDTQRIVDGLEAVEHMQELMEVIHDRQRQGIKALRASELAALRDFAAEYANVLPALTCKQYFQAQEGVENRIRRILSGEPIPASVRVIEAAPDSCGAP